LAYDVTIQSDGKIIAVGAMHSSGGPSDNPDFAVARYTTSGALDTSFGSGGIVTTGWGKNTDYANAVVIQADAKIVVGGSSNSEFALVRYNANGTLDKKFASSGKQITNVGGGGDGITALALQADGKILAAGFGTATAGGPVTVALARYNSNGTLDTNFGSAGEVITTLQVRVAGTPISMTLDASGKPVVCGPLWNGAAASPNLTDFLVARFNTNGSLDSSFGAGGWVQTDFFGQEDDPSGIVVLGTGKILVGGTTYTDSGSHFALAQYNPDGTLDSTLGTGGKVANSQTAGWVGHDLAVQADGKIIEVGSDANNVVGIARYNTGGTLDSTFGSAGTGLVVTSFPGGGGSPAFGVAIQTDGKIISAGNGKIDPSQSANFGLARYLGDSTTAATALTPSHASASHAAIDQFFADSTTVSILLTSEESKKH
jgi:uncharacterized delta-60 repeat protein